MDSWPQRFVRAHVFGRLSAGLVAVLFFAGCKKEDIRVYTVPKERTMEMASTAESDHAGGAPHIHYETPAGWTEEQPGGIRVARFSVPSKQGPQLDVSVIP